MWFIAAVLSSFFAGITTILAKCGIQKTDSDLATAIRTGIVLIFSWLMVFLVGSFDDLSAVSTRSLFFLVLSGIATGASWLCYFKALSIGNVNRVVAIDKSSGTLCPARDRFLSGDQPSCGKTGRNSFAGCRYPFDGGTEKNSTNGKREGLDHLRSFIRCVCGPYFDPCKGGYHRGRIEFGNRDPHRRCADYGVGRGLLPWKANRAPFSGTERASFYCVIRPFYRRFVAMLLLCASKRDRQRDRSDRPVKYCRFRSVFVPCFQGAFIQAGLDRPAIDDSRNPYHCILRLKRRQR